MILIGIILKSIAILLFLLTALMAILDIDKNNKGNYVLTFLFFAVLIIVL